MPILSRLAAAVPLLPLVALGTSGCHSPTPAKFNQGLGASEDSTLIVPFSERKNNRFYGESTRGTIVAETLKNWARVEWSVDFDESESVKQVLDKVRDRDTLEEIPIKDWQRLTIGLGVRFVVTGDIKKFQLRSPNRIGMLDPEATVSFRVVDVQKGRTVFADRDRSVPLFEKEDESVPITFVGQNLSRVEEKLLERIAIEVGKDLYGYTKR